MEPQSLRFIVPRSSLQKLSKHPIQDICDENYFAFPLQEKDVTIIASILTGPEQDCFKWEMMTREERRRVYEIEESYFRPEWRINSALYILTADDLTDDDNAPLSLRRNKQIWDYGIPEIVHTKNIDVLSTVYEHNSDLVDIPYLFLESVGQGWFDGAQWCLDKGFNPACAGTPAIVSTEYDIFHGIGADVCLLAAQRIALTAGSTWSFQWLLENVPLTKQQDDDDDIPSIQSELAKFPIREENDMMMTEMTRANWCVA